MNEEYEQKYLLECHKADLKKLKLTLNPMADCFLFTKNLSIGPSNQAVYMAVYQAFCLVKQRILDLENLIAEEESEK